MPTKILVADDSATMRRVLEMTFAGEDARVVSVDNGDAALQKALELTPDVVFADASMSGVDGYEVARRIKTNPQLAKVAVIVMASQHTPYDDGKGRAAGVDDHIPKPYDTQSVIDRVAQVLARPRNQPSISGESSRVAAAPAAAPASAPKPLPAPAAVPAAAPRAAVPNATRMGLGTPPGVAASAPLPAPVAAPAAKPAALPAAPVSALGKPAAAPAAKPATPATSPSPASAGATAVANGSDIGERLAQKLGGLGLSREQVDAVLALSREVVEQVVWEIVPPLAEQLIKEEIKRLTAE